MVARVELEIRDDDETERRDSQMNVITTTNRRAGLALSAQGLTPAATAMCTLRGRAHTGMPSLSQPKSALKQDVCVFVEIDSPRLDTPREVAV